MTAVVAKASLKILMERTHGVMVTIDKPGRIVVRCSRAKFDPHPLVWLLHDMTTTATITIIGATIITITAIGETYRVVAVSKLALRRARAAAHAAAFSLFGPMLDSRHEPRGHICRAATAAWYQ